MKDRITIEGRDGTFYAHIDDRRLCRLQPSLFCRSCLGSTPTSARPATNWQSEPGVDLSVTSEADWQHGLRPYQAYDRDAGVRDISDTLDTVAKLPECTGKIAAQGS